MADSDVGVPLDSTLGEVLGWTCHFEETTRKRPKGMEVIGVHLPPAVTLTSCAFADYQRPPVAGDGGSVGAGGCGVALDVGIL